MAGVLDRRRIETAEQISRRVLGEASFRRVFPKNSEGAREFIVALPNDKIGDVIRQIESSSIPVTICAVSGKRVGIVIVRSKKEPSRSKKRPLVVDAAMKFSDFYEMVRKKKSLQFSVEEPSEYAVTLARAS